MQHVSMMRGLRDSVDGEQFKLSTWAGVGGLVSLAVSVSLSLSRFACLARDFLCIVSFKIVPNLEILGCLWVGDLAKCVL